MTLTINETARRHFEWVEAMGWHSTPAGSSTWLALIASEIGEFTNECRGDKPTEYAVMELADIVLRCLDTMVGIRAGRGIPDPHRTIARHIVAPGDPDLPDHVADAICWPVAMREASKSLAWGLHRTMPGIEPMPLDLAWGLHRTLHMEVSGRNIKGYGNMIRAVMYTAKLLDMPLADAILAKLDHNIQTGNAKGRTT